MLEIACGPPSPGLHVNNTVLPVSRNVNEPSCNARHLIAGMVTSLAQPVGPSLSSCLSTMLTDVQLQVLIKFMSTTISLSQQRPHPQTKKTMSPSHPHRRHYPLHLNQGVRTCMTLQGSTNQMATIGTTPFIVPYFSMFSTRLLSPSITRNTFLAHPRPFPLQYH